MVVLNLEDFLVNCELYYRDNGGVFIRALSSTEARRGVEFKTFHMKRMLSAFIGDYKDNDFTRLKCLQMLLRCRWNVEAGGWR